MNTIHLCLVLHNHQPVGNFGNVFEAAYQDSYLPFLDVFERFPELNISLHTSGPLMKWFEVEHPEYLERLATLVAAGRIEIVGGAFYEPILAMIPGRDRVGQISTFTKWLENKLGGTVNGMWVPERVWESNIAGDIAEAGIQYTVLDDYHFRRAGVSEDKLDGYYVVEEEGRTVRVFPGSEKLRYLIPFSEPHETVDYCRQLADNNPGCVAVFGDDGEKFGTWPDTKQHVYDNGWLERFFQALTDNREWLKTSTLSTAVESTPPRGKVYLPDASYREMTEWSMPVDRQVQYDHICHEMEHDHRWNGLQKFIAGGFWRNFKIKYPESNHMYSRMMHVSKMLQQCEADHVDPAIIDAARDHLYQGQCNCSYWHGAFGGIYLPHLRNAVFHHLLKAESVLLQGMGKSEPWIEATADDYDFDQLPEVRLANDKLAAWIAPVQGGQLYELDVREIAHNLGATIQRRPELYHDKVRAGDNQGDDGAASIHDRVVFKQDGLDKLLQYDARLRASLIDHFWEEGAGVETVARSEAIERGDFADGAYQARIRRNPDRIQVLLDREGSAYDLNLKVTKGVTMTQGSDEIEIAYMIEGLPPGRQLHFGVEFNFAGLPDGLDDRFYSDADGKKLGQLETQLNLVDTKGIQLTDQWLGLELGLSFDQPGGIWTYPVRSVSQSEGGFELVHQCVCVQPHWMVMGDKNGRWATRMSLTFRTRSNDNQESHDQVAAAN